MEVWRKAKNWHKDIKMTVGDEKMSGEIELYGQGVNKGGGFRVIIIITRNYVGESKWEI